MGEDAAPAAVDDGARRQGLQPSRYYSWPDLMRRVFSVDVLECPDCHGPMRILAAIHPPEATRKILEHLGLPARPPPLAQAVPADRDAPIETFVD